MLKLLELFGGIGSPRKGLEKIGINFKVVDYVENNKHAVNSYNNIFNCNYSPQDIRSWNKKIDTDIIFHGSPCQDFSKEGKMKGADQGSETRSSLLWESLRIIQKLLPKVVIWENVPTLTSSKHIHVLNKYMFELSKLGYISDYRILNARDHGVPQNRRRIFVVSQLKDYYISDVLNVPFRSKRSISEYVNVYSDINHEYFDNSSNLYLPLYTNIKDGAVLIRQATSWGYIDAFWGDIVDVSQPNSETRRGRRTKDRSCPTITTGKHLCLVTQDNRLRYLTSKETWLLMGFDLNDWEKASKSNSENQLRKQAGNSIVVDLCSLLFENLQLNRFTNNKI